MLEPPPKTLPIEYRMERPFRFGLGSVMKPQSSALPRFMGQRSVSNTSSVSSLPPASMSSTLMFGFAASLPATTEPELPLPQTMKSNCLLTSDEFCISAP